MTVIVAFLIGKLTVLGRSMNTRTVVKIPHFLLPPAGKYWLELDEAAAWHYSPLQTSIEKRKIGNEIRLLIVDGIYIIPDS
ncbi:hypothetical protein BDD12DRAFT_817225 [Trichophaea hybrida]|nr:hypothetical protein BDD12DRAFT_817225 [Trichophaea hybrida]